MKTIIKLILLLLFSSALYGADPVVPGTPDLIAGDDTNSTTDNITSKSFLTFTGDSNNTTTVTLYIDGVKQTTTSTSTPTYSLSKTLAEGTHNITVTDTNSTGSESAQSTALSVTVDLTNPTTTIELDSVNVDNITQDTTIDLSGTTENGAAVTINGSATGVTVTGATWTYTSAAQADGTYTFTAQSTDDSGRTASAAITVRVDTSSSTTITNVNYNNATDFMTASIDISGNTDVESPTIVEVDIAGTKYTTTSSATNGNSAAFNIYIPQANFPTLTEGTLYNVTLSVLSDKVGNDSNKTNGSFIYDLAGNTQSTSVSIDLTTPSNHYLSADNDWFKIDIPSKGTLTLDTNNANAEIDLYTNDAIYVDGTSNSLTKILNKGTYYVNINGTLDGAYTLTPGFTAFDPEIDENAIPKIGVLANAGSGYSSYFYKDGEILHTDSVEFTVKNGNKFYLDITQANLINIVSLKDGGQNTSINLTNSAISLSIIDNILYILNNNNQIVTYNIANLNNITLVNTYTVAPNMKKISAYKASNGETYIYAKVEDTQKDFIVYEVGVGNTITMKSFYDNLDTASLYAESGLLYIVGNTGISLFDIANEPAKPRFLTNSAGDYDSVNSYDGNIYVSLGGGLIQGGEARFDYANSVVNSTKLLLDTAIEINKYSGTADIDVFQVDLEYDGNLTLATAGVLANDLNISISSDATLTDDILASTDVKDTSVSKDLNASTYYIKISTTDVNTSDSYTFTPTFTPVDNIKDKILNTSLAGSDDLTPSPLADSGIYQFSVDVDTVVKITSGTATVNSAQMDSNTSFVNSWSADLNNTTISAGTYYMKVTSAPVSYTFTSVGTNTTEYNNALRIDSKASVTNLDLETNSILLNNDILNISSKKYHTNILNSGTNITNVPSFIVGTKKKEYLSQISDGMYFYALYKYTNPIDSSIEVGIDKFEYINVTNIHIVKSTVIDDAGIDTFSYNMLYSNNKLYIASDKGLLEVNTSDLVTNATNATLANAKSIYMKGTKLYLALTDKVSSVDTAVNITDVTDYVTGAYLDIASDGTLIYAISSNKLDVISGTIVTKSKTFSETLQSIVLSNGLVYVGTLKSGILALDTSKTTIVKAKQIATARNVIDLQNVGDELYILEEKSTAVTTNRAIHKTKLIRDFGADRSNATLVSLSSATTGTIRDANDRDYMKVKIDYTGALSKSITNNTSTVSCTLLDFNSTLGSCDQNISAGTYYLDLNSSAATSYTLNISHTPINGDQQDTLNFFNTPSTNITGVGIVKTFTGNISLDGDVDNFKVVIDTAGVVDLTVSSGDANVTLTYENGTEVEKENNSYVVSDSGEYFIKVTKGTNTSAYTITTSFGNPLDNKFIDKSTAENKKLSTTSFGGTNSLVISSGKYLYYVDEVGGFNVVDITDQKAPVKKSIVNLTGTPKRLFLDGTILYVALGTDGYAIIDVSDITKPYLYGQFSAGLNIAVESIVAKGRDVYLACGTDKIKKFDTSDVSNPSLVTTYTFGTDIRDLEIDDAKLYVADITDGLLVRNLDNALSASSSLATLKTSKIRKDSNYIFAVDDSSVINIVELNTTTLKTTYTLEGIDTTAVLNATNVTTVINDINLNSEILYISRSDAYEIVEYKDINNITSIKYTDYKTTNQDGDFDTYSVNSICFSNNSLVLAKPKMLEILEGTPDYADRLTDQQINSIDIYNTTSGEVQGQFSSNGDIDSFKFYNVDYTGEFSLNITASDLVSNTVTKSDGTTVEDKSSITINSGDFFLQVKSSDNTKQFSYSFNYSFIPDDKPDVLKNTLEYETIAMNTDVQGTHYEGGGDKDYHKMTVDSRGTISFINKSGNAKITLLYESGTPISSNYDSDTSKVVYPFEADLSAGTYYVLVENGDNEKAEKEYLFTVSFTPTTDVVMDSGASATKIDSIDAVSYNSRYIFLLNDNKLTRYSNLLDSENELLLDQLNNTDDKQLTLYTYKTGDEIISYIGYVDYTDGTKSEIIKTTFNASKKEFTTTPSNADMTGLSDERIVFIDENEYIYYYDDDSIYIAPMGSTQSPQQLVELSLTELFVKDNIMYVVSKDNVRLVDVSDKNSIGADKVLSTISTTNAKSIYVDSDSNRLFLGANNKIEIWDISDKSSATMLSEVDVSFEDGDMFYEGTPTSIFLNANQLIVTVDGVGILVYNVDQFNTITLKTSVLNIGEKLSDAYTLDGAALNYTLADSNGSKELKVYFYATDLLDGDSASTFTVVNGEASEGCFIATAAYGNYFMKNVKVLRDFRDTYLLNNELGREFVELYYTYSPPIAREIAKSEGSKMAIRTILTPVVYMIKYPVIPLFLILTLLFYMVRINQNKSTLKVRKSL